MTNKKEQEMEEILNVIEYEDENLIQAEAKITYDKKQKQYSIKIPKRIAKTVNLNPEKDTFKFKVKTYPLEDTEPELIGELIRK